MNKILKTISFLLLSVCFMLNTNIVYAAKHPQCKKASAKDGYFTETWKDWKRTDFYTEYLSHDLVELAASIDNKMNEKQEAACISIAKGIGGLTQLNGVGDITAGLFALIRNSFLSEGDKMLLESAKNSYCGVKVHYWRDIFGNWHYHGFDPQ